MLRWISLWRSERAAAAEERLVEDTFAEAFGRPNMKQIKGWKDRELHAWLVSTDLQPVERSMAEGELRHREAWSAPAGRAYRMSRWALALSIVAILVTAAQVLPSIIRELGTQTVPSPTRR